MGKLDETAGAKEARRNANLEGLEYPSTGVCSGCRECMDDLGYTSPLEFVTHCESGRATDEGMFSSRPCDICDETLAGDRFIWHYRLAGEIQHDSDCCPSCLLWLNGSEEDPE